MCINFTTPSRAVLAQHFHISVPELWRWEVEAWPDSLAPIIIDQGDGPQPLLASYGFVPKKYLPPDKHFSTTNARAETIGSLKTYAGAWRKAQLCLVPMLGFYEPNYESGKAERWRIGLADDEPFAVAGLFRSWEEEGTLSWSFTQITINADDHPLMRRMHKPNDEKRSLVIVPPAEYEHWLTCRDPEVTRTFLHHYPAEQMTAISTGPYQRQRSPKSDSMF